jgi:hypothetical protein
VPINEGDAIPSATELSKKSITSLLPKLDVDKDLKLVRRSKPLLWDSVTVLETFLYRYFFSQVFICLVFLALLKHFILFISCTPSCRVVEEKEDLDSPAGRDLEERLGAETHLWQPTRSLSN